MIDINFTNVFAEKEADKKNVFQRIADYSERHYANDLGLSWEKFEEFSDGRNSAVRGKNISGEELAQLFSEYCNNFFSENWGKGYEWFIERLRWVELNASLIGGQEFSETIQNQLSRSYFM